MTTRIGTAGWSIPASLRARSAAEGSGLQQYVFHFPVVEINSSFYRPHKPATYARWAEITPPGFAFAVKVPQSITHDQRLLAARKPLAKFLGECRALGAKLGVVLLQLPPSLVFEPRLVTRFLATFRDLHDGPITCEPRHRSWFEPRVDATLLTHRIGRVAADPACCIEATVPRVADGIAYFRLHGSPRMYWSSYEPARLRSLADDVAMLQTRGATPWVIFDNTASQAAVPNALALGELLVN